MDRLTKEQRHKNMVANKGKGTKIELLLGKMLWNAGVRYRKNDSSLPGTPDFTVRNAYVAIFCDGEFWHGRNWADNKHKIKSNREFWYHKIEHNIERDAEITDELSAMGWKVFRFWESDIRQEPDRCVNEVLDYIHNRTNEKMAVGDTCNGSRIKMRMYGPHSLNNDGSIMCFDDQMAVVSHYLHNHGHHTSAPFDDLAEGLIEDICEESRYDEECTSVCEEDMPQVLFNDTFQAPFTPPLHPTFTFVDLFAGIGGFRMALQNLGGRCVFASEWDEEAKKTYLVNYGEVPFGDITKEETKTYIPNGFDILCAGLPLQAFTLIHKRDDFDKIRGTLFYEVAEVLRRRNPKAFILEFPVKQSAYEGGSAMELILRVLRNDLEYYVPDVMRLDAADFGVPQHRESLYVVGFSKDIGVTDFEHVYEKNDTSIFADIKEKHTVPVKYYLPERTVQMLSERGILNDNAGIIPGYDIIPDNGKAHTIITHGSVRDRNLVIDMRTTDNIPQTKFLNNKVNQSGVRRLTPKEWAQMQGFPRTFRIKVPDATAYKKFAASSVVPVVQSVANAVISRLDLKKKKKFTYGK